MANWIEKTGPHGGKIWINLKTGKEHYGDRPPSEDSIADVAGQESQGPTSGNFTTEIPSFDEPQIAPEQPTAPVAQTQAPKPPPLPKSAQPAQEPPATPVTPPPRQPQESTGGDFFSQLQNVPDGTKIGEFTRSTALDSFVSSTGDTGWHDRRGNPVTTKQVLAAVGEEKARKQSGIGQQQLADNDPLRLTAVAFGQDPASSDTKQKAEKFVLDWSRNMGHVHDQNISHEERVEIAQQFLDGHLEVANGMIELASRYGHHAPSQNKWRQVHSASNFLLKKAEASGYQSDVKYDKNMPMHALTEEFAGALNHLQGQGQQQGDGGLGGLFKNSGALWSAAGAIAGFWLARLYKNRDNTGGRYSKSEIFQIR